MITKKDTNMDTMKQPKKTEAPSGIVRIYGYGTHASIIVITGKRHSGKSFFLKNALMPNFPFFILWDYNHEHKFPKVPVTYKLSDIPALFMRHKRVVYRPLDKSLSNFNSFCRVVYNLSDFMLVIEEAERYATKFHSPPALKWIVDTGRHRGIGLTVTCRRPVRLHTDIPSNADYIFMFHQHMTVDIDYLAEWVGEEAYMLRDIEQYGFLIYSDIEGRVIGKYKI